MERAELIQALGSAVPEELAKDMVEEFLELRRDVATRTLGRSAPGKFIETFVQMLQYMEAARFDPRPSIDEYLRVLESRPSSLGDGLRICGSRLARAMYALRNKRNISHKGDVDPNSYDLAFLLSGAQWILAELIRSQSQVSMAEAGKLVEQVQAPIGGLVEDFGERRLVLGEMSAGHEVLVLLHSRYPDVVTFGEILSSTNRRKEKTVRNAVLALWREKALEGDTKQGYKLTRLGHRLAADVISRGLGES